MLDVLERFITAKIADGRAERTIEDYHRCLDPFVAWCEEHGITLDNLSRDDVRRYVARLRRRDLAAATVAIHIRNIRTFLGWVWREGLTESNLATALKSPPTHRRDELPLSPEEIAALLSACTGPQAIRDRAIILFLLDTGLRVGEMVSITMDQIQYLNETGGCLWIYGSKTGEWRFVFVGQRTAASLSQYIEDRDDDIDALWVGRQGPLTGRGVAHMLKRRGRAAGIEERVHPHIFRRTFATLWLDAGGDQERMRVILGWSPETLAKMMEIYVSSKRRELEEAHRRAGPVDNLPR